MSNFSRDIEALASSEFDVLVIGGGVNGAACAWDASLRGLKTALLEKADFGGATSAGCFKIVHGGVRYLQHLDLTRLFESVEEQQVLRKIAPHLVHPLPFLIPTYKGLGMKSRPVLSAGFMLYELLSFARNRGVSASHVLPRFRVLSREAMLEHAPGLSADGLSGGLQYYDCQMSNCDRLTFSVLRSAADAGAVVANYAEVISMELLDDIIEKVEVRDLTSGKSFSVRAKQIVNATGPWHHKIDAMAGVEAKQKRVFSKGVQVVLPQILPSHALAIESPYRDAAAKVSRGARSYFMHPWQGHTLLGTSDEVVDYEPDEYGISSDDVAELCAEARAAYASDIIDVSNVQYAFGGLREVDAEQLESGESGDATVARSDRLIQHHTPSNLTTVVGVKYTTFRALAKRVVDLLVPRFAGASFEECATQDTPLWGASGGRFSAKTLLQEYSGVSQAQAMKLFNTYGSAAADVLFCLEGEVSDASILHAEVRYVAQQEMVQHFSDIAYRRIGFGILGMLADERLRELISVAGEVLSWDATREEEELSLLKAHIGTISAD